MSPSDSCAKPITSDWASVVCWSERDTRSWFRGSQDRESTTSTRKFVPPVNSPALTHAYVWSELIWPQLLAPGSPTSLWQVGKPSVGRNLLSVETYRRGSSHCFSFLHKTNRWSPTVPPCQAGFPRPWITLIALSGTLFHCKPVLYKVGTSTGSNCL